MTKDTDRHSRPVATPEHRPLSDAERAPIEAANGLRQFDRLIAILDEHLQRLRSGSEPYFPVRPSLMMELNRLAVDQLIANPGAYRQTPMEISRSKHKPPRWEDVPQLVDEMCEYVTRNWEQSAVHLAAYLLWRVNWIHPFTDGNGRTARAISYLVLCVRLRQRLPGDRTMPDFISDEKKPYYAGLEAADDACANGKIDVSILEAYLRTLLVEQVERAVSTGTDKPIIARSTPEAKRDSEAIAKALGTTPPSAHRAAWITGGAALLVALIGAGVALSRCNKELRCVVGVQQTCRCPGGGSGVQMCAEDGLHYTSCDCALLSPPAPIAVPVDAATRVGAPRD